MLLFMESTIVVFFFFFNDTAPTEIYTLSLHDALPIFDRGEQRFVFHRGPLFAQMVLIEDRKSTRLNSSHVRISYAVFCLKKKKPTLQTFNTAWLYSPYQQMTT